MYGQNHAPQAERTRTRTPTPTDILDIDQQKAFVWRWAAAILFTGLTFAVGNVVAGTNTAYDIHDALLKHQQTQTVGYRVAWMGRLSGLARQAFNDDDYAMAKRVWQILAKAGDAEAAYKLGMLYDTGADGVEQDPELATHWYLQAAQAGHLHAQHNLAVAYASGDGVKMDIGNTSIKVFGSTSTSQLKAVNIKTHEYPGFPTDLQAPMTVFLTQACGESLVFETIFEGRLNYIESLSTMGANIKTMDPHRVIINGPSPLHGKTLESPDLRAGLAFVIAAIIAKGSSVIHNVYNIDRGYEKVEEALQGIGVDVMRVGGK